MLNTEHKLRVQIQYSPPQIQLTCFYAVSRRRVRRSLRLQAVWETAWNEIRIDSSEMNPGWSLAPANQITTKGSSAWGESVSGKLRS